MYVLTTCQLRVHVRRAATYDHAIVWSWSLAVCMMSHRRLAIDELSSKTLPQLDRHELPLSLHAEGAHISWNYVWLVGYARLHNYICLHNCMTDLTNLGFRADTAYQGGRHVSEWSTHAQHLVVGRDMHGLSPMPLDLLSYSHNQLLNVPLERMVEIQLAPWTAQS